MNWQQLNWPVALLIYLGLFVMFGVIVYCSYFPIRFMKVPADRKFYFRWLLVLWSLSFLIGFVLPTLTLFGVLPNWSITDPANYAPLIMALVFMVFFPWIFRRMKASPKPNLPERGNTQ
jgi:hypothetical protein